MIVKIIRRDTPFALVDRRILEDTRLSWKAKGIMAYLLSRPHDWQIVSADLTARSTDGRDATLAGMMELRKLGYAQLRTQRDEKGQLSGKYWAVFEEPQEPDSETILPKDGKPEDGKIRTSDNPIGGKPATTNKKEEQRRKVTKKDVVFEIPESLNNPRFIEQWETWVAHRKEIKKPLTQKAIDQQLKDCEEWGVERAIAALKHSIRGSYQGLFEPSQQRNGFTQMTPAQSRPKFGPPPSRPTDL